MKPGKAFEILVKQILLTIGFSEVNSDGLYIFDGAPGQMIQGLGEAHNADVLLEPPVQTPFYSSTRLLVECKDYQRRIGLNTVRSVLGLREDINHFEILDMGGNITEYTGFWSVEKFNLFETNLDLLNEKILSRDFGTKQVFFENGPFIGYAELNRIESAILDMKESLDNMYSGLRRMPFRLGNFRNIRI